MTYVLVFNQHKKQLHKNVVVVVAVLKTSKLLKKSQSIIQQLKP